AARPSRPFGGACPFHCRWSWGVSQTSLGMNAVNPEGYTTPDGRRIGGVLMEMKNITLRFGGVKAITDISFDIREGEIRAIIGPNGAGKSSMLNVISGFYVPQEGEVWFKGYR